jgi:hypothetical protein
MRDSKIEIGIRQPNQALDRVGRHHRTPHGDIDPLESSAVNKQNQCIKVRKHVIDRTNRTKRGLGQVTGAQTPKPSVAITASGTATCRSCRS